MRQSQVPFKVWFGGRNEGGVRQDMSGDISEVIWPLSPNPHSPNNLINNKGDILTSNCLTPTVVTNTLPVLKFSDPKWD